MIHHIAWAGNAYFAAAMRARGLQVTVLPRKSVIGWDDVLAVCGRSPDLFIYGDVSATPFLRGIETFPCPTVFYAIDTHIHGWYPRYAQAFDLCCVAMRDHLPGFLGQRLAPEQVRWLPLFSQDRDRRVEVDGPPTDEILFVGKNDPELTPGRHRFLAELARRAPLTVRRGSYPELYARAKLVLNVSEHGDLNFRVFEALGCGACLLTPRVGHGLLDLFRDGEELFCYDPEDMDALVDLTARLLADETTRTRVARAGMDTVRVRHRTEHRAQDLLIWLSGLDLDTLVTRRRADRADIHRDYLRLLYLHLAESESAPGWVRFYLDLAGSGQPGGSSALGR